MNKDFTKTLLSIKEELTKFQNALIEDANKKLEMFEKFQGEYEELAMAAATELNNKDLRKFAKEYYETIENEKILEDWKNIKTIVEGLKNGN